MKKLLMVSLIVIMTCSVISQDLPQLKLNDESGSSIINKDFNEKILNTSSLSTESLNKEPFQLKKRKTVNSYFGAGYSLIIFTNSLLSEVYPILDTRSGSFLTNISLFFGFAIAQAVAMEFEPALLFSNSSKTVKTSLGKPHTPNGVDSVAYSSNMSLFAIPLTINVRFFPFFKLKSYARLFFIGAGGGVAWIKEDYDTYYTDNPNLYTGGYSFGGISESTSQWAPVIRGMIGVTGTGGQFGFGGEVRYNYVPLKQQANSPFRTRISSNFNSVDITLRFYFSL